MGLTTKVRRLTFDWVRSWKHVLHGMDQDLGRILLRSLATRVADAARAVWRAEVHLLLPLAAGEVDLGDILDLHDVAGVQMRNVTRDDACPRGDGRRGWRDGPRIMPSASISMHLADDALGHSAVFFQAIFHELELGHFGAVALRWAADGCGYSRPAGWHGGDQAHRGPCSTAGSVSRTRANSRRAWRVLARPLVTRPPSSGRGLRLGEGSCRYAHTGTTLVARVPEEVRGPFLRSSVRLLRLCFIGEILEGG